MAGWTKADFDTYYRVYGERWGHPGNRPAIMLGYHWHVIGAAQAGVQRPGQTKFHNYPLQLATVLGLAPGDAVLIVGAGFNWTGHGLSNLGYRVIGTELSDYIQAQKGQTEEAEIRAAIAAAGVNPDTDLVTGPNGAINPLDLLLEGGRAVPGIRGKGEILAEEMRVRGSRNAVLNRFNTLWPGVVPRYIVTEEVLNSIPDAQALLVCDYVASAASEWGSTVVHMLSPLQVDLEQAASLNWKTYAGWRTFLNANGFTAQRILPTVTAWSQGMVYPPTLNELTALFLARGYSAETAAAKAALFIAEQRVVAYSGLF